MSESRSEGLEKMIDARRAEIEEAKARQRKWLREKYGLPEFALDAAVKIREYEYADNLRIARAGDAIMAEEYQRQRRRGCCGSYDTAAFGDTTDDVWLVGWNYGH